MPTDIEVRVLKALSATEVPPETAEAIEALGNEAVTVVSEAALGTYPGLRPKARTNAVALLGWMKHPQALETTRLLMKDTNSDISIRAMRAAGRQRNEQVVGDLSSLLRKTDLSPLLAAEAVKSLVAIDTPNAKEALRSYEALKPEVYPHRRSPLVNQYLPGEKRG